MFLFLKSKRQLKRLQRLLQQNNYNATPNCRQNDPPAVFLFTYLFPEYHRRSYNSAAVFCVFSVFIIQSIIYKRNPLSSHLISSV